MKIMPLFASSSSKTLLLFLPLHGSDDLAACTSVHLCTCRTPAGTSGQPMHLLILPFSRFFLNMFLLLKLLHFRDARSNVSASKLHPRSTAFELLLLCSMLYMYLLLLKFYRRERYIRGIRNREKEFGNASTSALSTCATASPAPNVAALGSWPAPCSGCCAPPTPP